MGKQSEQRSNDSIMMTMMEIIQGSISDINGEIKDINEKLNPVCLIIKGNGVEPLSDQIKENTDWRLKMTGGIKLVLIILGGSGGFGILLKILKII